MKGSKRYEFTHGIVEYVEEGYVQHTLLSSLTEVEAEETVDAILSFAPPDGKISVLVNMRYRGMLSRKARRVFEGRTLQKLTALAAVSNSKLSEIIFNFWLKFGTSYGFTTRVFQHHKDASKWLMAQNVAQKQGP